MAANGKVEKGGKEISAATLDEAMMLTGFGIYNILHMLLSGLILMGVIMQNLAMGYVLPSAQCDLQLTTQQKGWLAAIPFLAIILMSYFWGWLADTRGRRPTMLFSMLVASILSALASFAPEIISFAVLQFLASLFVSCPSSVVYTYLGEFNNMRHRDKMVAFGASFVGIGTVALAAVSWLILPLDIALPIPFLNITYRSWRLLIVACAMPFACGTVLLLFAPESPKFLNASGQQEACLEALKKMYSVNKRMPADTFPVKSLMSEYSPSKQQEGGMKAVLQSMREQTAPLFRPPLLPWTALSCFVQFGIFATTNGFYIWFPTILNSLTTHEGAETRICDVLDATKASADNGTSIICDDTMSSATFERSIYIGLVFYSMYLIVGVVVDTLGKKLILVIVLGCTGLCGVGANLAYNQQLAVVLFAIFQMSGACIGLMNAVTVELFPTKYRAMAVCLSMMTGRVGSMVGSNVIGVLLDTNCGASFYLFGGVIIGCALLCLTLPSKGKSPTKKLTTEAEPTQNQTQEPV
ncbi:putative transporter SVOPL [Epargyreus clarus]|uniref:putative transporter SVOPL n=1 Tax=Epargyreus clarus TaxID=520877 RepID=UPI003C30923E